MKNNPQKELTSEISLVTLSSEMLVLLIIPIFLLTGLGLVVDRFVGSGFFFMIFGAIVGSVVASVLAVRKVTAVMRQAEEQYQILLARKKEEEKNENHVKYEEINE